MNRRRGLILIAGGLALLVTIMAGSIVYAGCEPDWNAAYFTLAHCEKYTTVEDTFQAYVAALGQDSPALYNEVLGYDSHTPTADFPLYTGPSPAIEKLEIKGDWAFAWTSNRWECNFRRVRGRWVFWPEDWRMLVRQSMGW